MEKIEVGDIVRCDKGRFFKVLHMLYDSKRGYTKYYGTDIVDYLPRESICPTLIEKGKKHVD